MTSLRDLPILKQFGRLRRIDFKRSPVWVACHTLDHDEPWYEETNEETFRPYFGQLPFDPARAIALVSATFVLADRTTLPGFVTPTQVGGRPKAILALPQIADQQPHIFVAGGRQLGFWWGMITPPEDFKSRSYASLHRQPDQVFPINFSADPGLAVGVTSGRLDGFCYAPDLKTVTFVR